MNSGTRLLVVANVAVLAAIVGIGGYEFWQARDDREQSGWHMQRITAMVESAQAEMQRLLQNLTEGSRGAEDGTADSLAGLTDRIEKQLQVLGVITVSGPTPPDQASLDMTPVAIVAPSEPPFSTRSDASRVAGGSTQPSGEFASMEAVTQTPTAELESERRLQQVHFLYDSEELTPGGKSRIKLAAEEIARQPPSRIQILGFSDSVGGSEYNSALSYRRAESVAVSLVAAGVPADLVEIIGRGENGPIATGDGVAEPLNRCVAIVAVN